MNSVNEEMWLTGKIHPGSTNLVRVLGFSQAEKKAKGFLFIYLIFNVPLIIYIYIISFFSIFSISTNFKC